MSLKQSLAELQREHYIGDAVYASFDGFNVWLRTGDGNNQRIALEPGTLMAFDAYRKRLAEGIKQYQAEALAAQAAIAEESTDGA